MNNFITKTNLSPEISLFDSFHHLDSPNSNVKFFHQPSSEIKEDVQPSPIDEENLKMPLVFLPKSTNKNLWNKIASDILRSIHSEYSFAKRSDFGFKKQSNKIIHKFETEVSSPKLRISLETQKKETSLILFFLYSINTFFFKR